MSDGYLTWEEIESNVTERDLQEADSILMVLREFRGESNGGSLFGVSENVKVLAVLSYVERKHNQYRRALRDWHRFQGRRNESIVLWNTLYKLLKQSEALEWEEAEAGYDYFWQQFAEEGLGLDYEQCKDIAITPNVELLRGGDGASDGDSGFRWLEGTFFYAWNALMDEYEAGNWRHSLAPWTRDKPYGAIPNGCVTDDEVGWNRFVRFGCKMYMKRMHVEYRAKQFVDTLNEELVKTLLSALFTVSGDYEEKFEQQLEFLDDLTAELRHSVEGRTFLMNQFKNPDEAAIDPYAVLNEISRDGRLIRERYAADQKKLTQDAELYLTRFVRNVSMGLTYWYVIERRDPSVEGSIEAAMNVVRKAYWFLRELSELYLNIGITMDYNASTDPDAQIINDLFSKAGQLTTVAGHFANGLKVDDRGSPAKAGRIAGILGAVCASVTFFITVFGEDYGPAESGLSFAGFTKSLLDIIAMIDERLKNMYERRGGMAARRTVASLTILKETIETISRFFGVVLDLIQAAQDLIKTEHNIGTGDYDAATGYGLAALAGVISAAGVITGGVGFIVAGIATGVALIASVMASLWEDPKLVEWCKQTYFGQNWDEDSLFYFDPDDKLTFGFNTTSVGLKREHIRITKNLTRQTTAYTSALIRRGDPGIFDITDTSDVMGVPRTHSAQIEIREGPLLRMDLPVDSVLLVTPIFSIDNPSIDNRTALNDLGGGELPEYFIGRWDFYKFFKPDFLPPTDYQYAIQLSDSGPTTLGTGTTYTMDGAGGTYDVVFDRYSPSPDSDEVKLQHWWGNVYTDAPESAIFGLNPPAEVPVGSVDADYVQLDLISKQQLDMLHSLLVEYQPVTTDVDVEQLTLKELVKSWNETSGRDRNELSREIRDITNQVRRIPVIARDIVANPLGGV